MEKMILNLKFKYKGKYLDIAKYNRDFHNRFFVGSDKNLMWQILNSNFPEKFLLIERKKDYFILHLWDKMDILVKEGNQIFTKQQLIETGILKDNRLLLKENQMGRIRFLDDWEIEYSFVKPVKKILSDAEKQVIKQFATFSKLSPLERNTRIFLLLGVLLTVGLLYIFEANYQPPEINSLVERLSQLEKIATRVEVPVVEEEKQPKKIYKPREESEQEVAQQVQQAARITAAEFEAEFGLSLDASLSGGTENELNNQLLEITEVQEIVSTGEGSKSGVVPQITRGASELDVISSKIQLDEGEGLGSLGGLEGIDLDAESGFEEIDLANLGGNIEQYKITKIESKKKFEEIKKHFSGIKMMQEGNIEIQEM
ncbi:MAG TPA: hypothetical protein ENL20_10465, partial [Candidatus Cloacimonetes bacterium]|nr:hypothetical protein [Candidatus Cloacimonadota bacterium]